MDVIKKGEEDEVTSLLKAKYNNTPLSGEQGKGAQKTLNFLNNTPIAEWASPKDHVDIILADDGSAAATGVQTP